MTSNDNLGWHQLKFDTDAYNKISHERQHLCKSRHASFSDAFREIYNDAMMYRKK